MSGTQEDPIQIPDDPVDLELTQPRRDSAPRGGSTVMNRPSSSPLVPTSIVEYTYDPNRELKMTIACTLTLGDTLVAWSIFIASWFF